MKTKINFSLFKLRQNNHYLFLRLLDITTGNVCLCQNSISVAKAFPSPQLSHQVSLNKCNLINALLEFVDWL